MVRKRGVARTSFARRRMRRVKKYDHNVIPIRFKLQLGDMSGRIESPLDKFVACETPTMNKLADLGVPTEEYPYYIGFMKEMLSIYLRFVGDTLIRERVNLLEEYLLRGKDVNVLIALDEVAAGCAGVPYVFILTCDDVKACLEGNYGSWTYQWTHDFGGDSYPCYYPHFVNINESSDFLWIYDPYSYNIQQLKISDGTLLSEFAVLDYGNCVEFVNYSLLMKYFAIVKNVGGVPHLYIYKDGSLQQDINLQTTCGWTNVTTEYVVTMSTDGKYILVCNYKAGVNDYALFKGS